MVELFSGKHHISVVLHHTKNVLAEFQWKYDYGVAILESMYS